MEIINNTEVVTGIREKFLTFDIEGKIKLNASDWNGKNVIYMIVNLSNKMRYIGKTTHLLNRANNYILNYRKEDSGDHRLLIRDMRKYGIENFRMFPIAVVRSRPALAEAEQFYTEQYNTYWPKGYNTATVSSTLNQLYKRDSGHPHTIATKMKKAKLVACINPDTHEMYVSVGMKLFGDLVGKSKDIIKNAAKAPIRICGFYIIYLSKVDRDEIVQKVQERVEQSEHNPTKRSAWRSNHDTYYAMVSDVETMLIEENPEIFQSNGYTCNFLTYNEEHPENGLSFDIQPISEFFALIPSSDNGG